MNDKDIEMSDMLSVDNEPDNQNPFENQKNEADLDISMRELDSDDEEEKTNSPEAGDNSMLLANG